MSKKPNREHGVTNQNPVVASMTAASEHAKNEGKDIGKGMPGHAGQVGKDKQGRSKATYNINLDRQAMVSEMADAEDNTTKASIAEAAIVLFYNFWKAGLIDFYELREPAMAARAKWELSVSDDFGENFAAKIS
jgi:uncharacterized protein YdbL (DUF1318 family)